MEPCVTISLGTNLTYKEYVTMLKRRCDTNIKIIDNSDLSNSTCPRCKSINYISTDINRSLKGDEGEITIKKCMDCGLEEN